jgi:O-antigen ligase
MISAFATIIFYIFPNLYYDDYLPLLIDAMGNQIQVFGYKSALATHYSQNGIYLAIGVIVFSTDLFSRSKIKIFSIVSILVMIFALLLTTKRGVLLFSVVAILFAWFICNEKRIVSKSIKLISFILIALLLLYYLSTFIPELQDTYNRFFDNSSDDITSGRLQLWQFALQLFYAHPIIGTGWHSFPIIYRGYTGIDMEAHNVFIQLLSETGIVGFVFVLSMFIAMLRLTFSIINKVRFGLINLPENYKQALFFSLTYQIFFLCYCITGNVLYDISTFISYMFSCSIAFSLKKYAMQKSIHYNEIPNLSQVMNKSIWSK